MDAEVTERVASLTTLTFFAIVWIAKLQMKNYYYDDSNDDDDDYTRDYDNDGDKSRLS